MWKKIALTVQKTKKKIIILTVVFLTFVGCCNQQAITQSNAESMISKDCDGSVAKLILRDRYKCLKQVLKLSVYFSAQIYFWNKNEQLNLAFKLTDVQSICRNLVKFLHRLRCFLSTTAVIKKIKAGHNKYLLLYNRKHPSLQLLKVRISVSL